MVFLISKMVAETHHFPPALLVKDLTKIIKGHGLECMLLRMCVFKDVRLVRCLCPVVEFWGSVPSPGSCLHMVQNLGGSIDSCNIWLLVMGTGFIARVSLQPQPWLMWSFWKIDQ